MIMGSSKALKNPKTKSQGHLQENPFDNILPSSRLLYNTMKKISSETLDGLTREYEFLGSHIKAGISVETKEEINPFFFAELGFPSLVVLIKDKENQHQRNLYWFSLANFCLSEVLKYWEINHPSLYTKVYILDGGFKNYVTILEPNWKGVHHPQIQSWNCSNHNLDINHFKMKEKDAFCKKKTYTLLDVNGQMNLGTFEDIPGSPTIAMS
ncbi:uncharacterized protein MELLADRAFT_89820 [Melampsora larici-populina 98AG31]|uniref:Uncharacterized protein n=1 Tax=Melampsora larici-populina (strain 98AG31 / pathotype 3-4-7) TaxID=747676 RepID=F4RUQ9_MELLP|nr:uncharacterized protein MELLADRAFT_89820 [Melampsora larici-populina 98AG31]EGG03740.1 hypothetical protein MELLADRAFT_89820 [Melampsora larici-populina 98AG31]